MVEQRGMRAQLRSGNLLTGQLYVAFDSFPNAPKAKSTGTGTRRSCRWSRAPFRTSKQSSPTSSTKLDKLPLDAIGEELKKTLVSLDQTLQDAGKAVDGLSANVTPGLKTTLDDLRGTIGIVDRVLKNTDATLVGKDAPAQQELRDALQEITRAARSLRVLADYLQAASRVADSGKERSSNEGQAWRGECEAEVEGGS